MKKYGALLVTGVALAIASATAFAHGTSDPVAGPFQNMMSALLRLFS